jgi:phosphoribosylformylglycinamidine synthase
MKNDSVMGGRKISIPPTVLFSAIARMDDISKAVTLDAKFADDDVYVIGKTSAELGGSEFYAMLGATGRNVPKVDAEYAKNVYNAVSEITEQELAHSLHTPAIGGLAAGFAKVAVGGRLGLSINLDAIPADDSLSPHELLFSESNSRFILTAAQEDAEKIEKILDGIPFSKVGKVTDNGELTLKSRDFHLNLLVDELARRYKTPLDGV